MIRLLIGSSSATNTRIFSAAGGGLLELIEASVGAVEEVEGDWSVLPFGSLGELGAAEQVLTTEEGNSEGMREALNGCP